MEIESISIDSIKDFNIGHAANEQAGTGVSVIYFPNGAKAGCDISGGGPASRETPLTMSTTADNPINAIVLSGGSAYGLAAADGVMRCLEEHGKGYDTKTALVPLVCQSCIYDLGYKSSSIRPDADMGYHACENAIRSTDCRQGNVGGGTGATVGKLLGMTCATKSGLGIHAVRIGTITMAAVVIVNAAGDVYDDRTGKIIAGLKSADRTTFLNSESMLYKLGAPKDSFTGNTTIGAVITNAEFSKAQLNKIASMTRNAYAKCINPVGTMADGDSIYAASTCEHGIKADINFCGTLAARVMCEAIKNAITNSAISDEEYLRTVNPESV